jgi:hypothetical protein
MNLIEYLFKLLWSQAGSVSMPNWWVHKFHAEFYETYQQMNSLVMAKMDGKVIRRGVQAAIDYWERFDDIVLPDGAVRHGQSVILNMEHSRRACTMINSEGGVLVSDVDTLRAMADPQSPSRDALIYAAIRRADKHVINAAVGTAITVTTGTDGQLTQGSQALPSANTIGTGIAITLANIIAANEFLSKRSVPSGPGKRKALYSPGQLRDLMAITQASSSDFTKNQIHDKGTIDGLTWEGAEWVEIPDTVNIAGTSLQAMLPLSSTTRSCIFMANDAVGLSIGKEYSVEIDRRPDLRNEIQVYLKMMMTAVRIYEGGVVVLSVLEN